MITDGFLASYARVNEGSMLDVIGGVVTTIRMKDWKPTDRADINLVAVIFNDEAPSRVETVTVLVEEPDGSRGEIHRAVLPDWRFLVLPVQFSTWETGKFWVEVRRGEYNKVQIPLTVEAA